MVGFEFETVMALGKGVYAQFGRVVAHVAQGSGVSLEQLADLRTLMKKAVKQTMIERSATAQRLIPAQITADEHDRLKDGLAAVGMMVLPVLAELAEMGVMQLGQIAGGLALEKLADERIVLTVAAAGLFAATPADGPESEVCDPMGARPLALPPGGSQIRALIPEKCSFQDASS